MANAEVDGLNGLSDGVQSADMTLEDLLNDESLSCSSNFERIEESDQRKYQDCLVLYIGGDAEKALQKMYEYGFLTHDSLRNEDKYFTLCLEICHSIHDFRRLGFSLQEVIRQTFTGERQVVEDHLHDQALVPQVLTWCKYYSCCVSASLMDKPTDQSRALKLENDLRGFISRMTKELGTLVDVPGFEELIETYIFGVQIKILEKPRSTALYKQLCHQVPSLGTRLSVLHSIQKGKTVEQYLLSKLDTKSAKPKKQLRHHSRSLTEKRPIVTSKKPSQEPKPAENASMQVVTRWKSLCVKYFNKAHLSGQGLLFLLIILLMSFQSAKKLAKIPRFFTKFSASLVTQLKNLLRLLSSI